MNTPSYQVKKISKTIKSDLQITIWTSLAIIVGYLLKLLIPFDRKTIGKASYLTGIPYLRNNFFVIPVVLVFILIIQLIYIYNNNETLKNIMNNSLFKFLKKTHFGFLFSNLSKLFVFYILYYQIYSPYNRESQFKVSGHVTTVMFTGVIYSNIRHICNSLMLRNEKVNSLLLTNIICQVLFYHNLYTLIWTVWVFHPLNEAVVALCISVICVVVLTFLNIDRLVITLFDNGDREKEKKKII
jgi:hypothetical protein